MFDQRSNKKELMDDLTLADVELIKNLHEIKVTNRWLGSRHTLINALDKIYRKHHQDLHTRNITIADLGCGSGDLLRVTHEWARVKQLHASFIGLDGNSYITQQAIKLSTHYPNIKYQQADVFTNLKNYQFDIVTLNSFCHHLNENELVKLIRELQAITKTAIVINDLHRHRLAYYGIKLLSHALQFSAIGKHDGPTSVLRAFNKDDLIHLMDVMKITNYELCWQWAFRWQLIIWCH